MKGKIETLTYGRLGSGFHSLFHIGLSCTELVEQWPSGSGDTKPVVEGEPGKAEANVESFCLCLCLSRKNVKFNQHKEKED